MDADYLRRIDNVESGYNPFACGQDIAPRIVVERPTVRGSYASVLVRHVFGNGASQMATTVDLGSRKIVGTQCLAVAGVVGTH